MNGRRTVRSLCAGLCLPGLLLLTGCDKWGNQYVYVRQILKGNGACKPLGSERDYFGLLLEGFNDTERLFRGSLGLQLTTNTRFAFSGGQEYAFLLDAYADAGRIDDVIAISHDLWGRSKKDTLERWKMSKLYIDAKMRQYLWKHPDTAAEADLHRLRAEKGWYGFAWSHREFYSRRLIQAGDNEFEEAWKDHHANRFRSLPSPPDDG